MRLLTLAKVVSMSKPSEDNRYPHSAELFRFCKEALNIKHNFEVKVIDQHVGSILGFDPADCSHWKKGKKNIKSVQTLQSIATQLEIDPRLVADVATGRVDLEESLQEYRGFGGFSLSEKVQDELRREYFRNPTRFAQGAEPAPFEQVIDLQRSRSLTLTQELIVNAEVTALPVFLPEFLEALPHINIEQSPHQLPPHQLVLTQAQEGGRYRIVYRPGEMRPHIRFLLARELGRILLEAPGPTDAPLDDLWLARTNIFASLLLMPTALLQLATREADHTRDLIQQLCDVFWLSRSLVNARLKDYFINGN